MKMRLPSGRGSRADDELVLTMLRLRRSMVSPEVAASVGCSPERVRIATQRVRDDDLAYSGEDQAAVLGHYPWSRT